MTITLKEKGAKPLVYRPAISAKDLLKELKQFWFLHEISAAAPLVLSESVVDSRFPPGAC